VEYKYFYKNGQIQEQLEFEGNIKFLTNRDWTIEDKTPNLVVKKSFYENGILRSEHYMKKGDGYRHYYSDEGQLTSEELFSNYESVNN
jgi:antitoxin component YwqK of YwqJK toxin-antitoxin module